ncbi:MAG: TIGR01777 family oxidoreductase [Bacteroidota bacterium]|nr:TIGR01777 family oxidoreductase [Bacteroidota bacterium]
MKILALNGSSGFLGKQICQFFERKYTILKIRREDYLDPSALADKLKGVDIVVNLAGARITPVASKKYRKDLYDSRIYTTQCLVKAFSLMDKTPDFFISMSAIGIYDYIHIHNEESVNFGDDFLADLCKDWELVANNDNPILENTAIIRNSIVLSTDGGILKTVLPFFKVGLGTVMGNGMQPFSFIHISDFLRAIDFVIDHRISGIVNLAAPNFCIYLDFCRTLSKRLERPLFLKVPAYLLKLTMGEQSSMLLKGQKVLPEVLLNRGFRFEYTDIQEAINSLINFTHFESH